MSVFKYDVANFLWAIIFLPAIAFAQQDCSKAAKLLSSATVLGSRASDTNDMLEQSYELCPSSVEVAYAYGNSLAQKGSYQQALDVFSKGEDPILSISKASILAETGDFEQGSSILEKVLGESPRKVEALQALATLEYKRNNYRESERLIRLAIQEKSDDFSLFYNLGITLEKLKRYDEAKLSLLSSLRLNSNNSDAYCALTRIYLLKGNIIEARESANKAITIAPEDSLAWFSNGLVNQQQGLHEEALKSLTKA
jgi:tetratricopeptide (TPR) repeat protein